MEGYLEPRLPTSLYTRPMPLVADLMAADVLAVDAGAELIAAVRSMDERRVGAVLVLDGERLVGVFTERDVLRAVARRARRRVPPSEPG